MLQRNLIISDSANSIYGSNRLGQSSQLLIFHVKSLPSHDKSFAGDEEGLRRCRKFSEVPKKASFPN